MNELVTLYQSNVNITDDKDNELDCKLPNPNKLYVPTDFTEKVYLRMNYQKTIENLENNLNISLSYKDNQIILNKDDLSYIYKVNYILL